MQGSGLTKDEWKKVADGPDWGDILADKISLFNPVCCINFQRRWKKRSFKKSSAFIFTASGKCGFKSCCVTVSIKVPIEKQASDEKNVTVIFNGQPTHDMHERRARKIKGAYRKELQEYFAKSRIAPAKLFHSKLLELDNKAFLGGKWDKIGRTQSVLQKISSESRHIEEEHHDYITSLRVMADREADDPNKYIQCIQALPFMVICFNETAVRIYHELAPESALYCDATGTIVSLPGKRVLYYSLVIEHPTKGQSPLAVAEMTGTDHSVNGITYFLRTFQRLEGRIFGYGNLVTPKRVVLDRSLVLLISFLEVYNHETLAQYLDRCFKIVSGEGEQDDLLMLFPHACKAHMMKSGKDLARKR